MEQSAVYGGERESINKMMEAHEPHLTLFEDFGYGASNRAFSFIDLFAGIGGMRLAFQGAGGECVFSSEWDKAAQKTYYENFGEIPAGDITKIDENSIPDHDVLVAGFPCQPFSIAGVSKKRSLGREHGFMDKTQGTLFFDVARVLAAKRPRAFLLENVKNLLGHDKGQTYETIRGTLEELEYETHHTVIDARHYVPQHRQRVYIVGFDRRRFTDPSFTFPEPPRRTHNVREVLEDHPDGKYWLSDKLWNYLQAYAAKHRARGNGFGYGLVTPEDAVTRTLSARYYKDGSEILLDTGHRTPRRLTPRECANLMGFPRTFVIPVADTSAYKQFGNSVVVPVVQDIAMAVRDKLVHRSAGPILKEVSDGCFHPRAAEFSHVEDPGEGHEIRGASPALAVQTWVPVPKE